MARELRRVRDTYGAAAILDASRSGSTSMLHSRATVARLLNLLGGCTELWSNLSAEAEVFAVRHTYGPAIHKMSAGREPVDYANSRVILMWGWSPGDGHFGTGTFEYLKRASQHGTRIVCVDPRRTRTSRTAGRRARLHPPVHRRRDADRDGVVDRGRGAPGPGLPRPLVLGFDEAHLPADAPAGASYRAYLMGVADGVPKTPEWAAPIAGVPGGHHPPPGRRVRDQQAGRASTAASRPGGRPTASSSIARPTLSRPITGNIGVPGGNSGCSGGAQARAGQALDGGRQSRPARGWPRRCSPTSSTRGRAGGYPADIKLVYSVAGDLVNQCGNVNKSVAALPGTASSSSSSTTTS